MSSCQFHVFVWFHVFAWFHIFVSVSCLHVGLIMSLFRFHVFAWFHVFVSVSCLRMVSYLHVSLMSSCGLMSSCCFQIFASCHIFMLFSDLHIAHVSNGQWRFPANCFLTHFILSMTMTEKPQNGQTRQLQLKTAVEPRRDQSSRIYYKMCGDGAVPKKHYYSKSITFTVVSQIGANPEINFLTVFFKNRW